MRSPDLFDRSIVDWLADAGAQDIPGRVYDAAFAEARRTRRARRLPDHITRWLPMSTTFPTAPPMARARPQVRRLRPAAVLLALTLLALALLGAALLSAGGRTAVSAPVQNGLIAYDPNGDIWVADPDRDFQARQLTATAAQESNPVWSPDGSRIAYWSVSNGVSSIGIMDPEGTVLREVTKPAGLDLPSGGAPAWLPDGRTIEVVAKPDFSATVLIDTETGEARQTPVFVQLAQYSPDGSLIAWGNVTDVPPGVHIAAANGTDARTVSTTGLPAGVVAFTHDVRRLLYVERSPDGSDGEIMSVGVEGTDRQTIVGGPTNDFVASLSPDGTQIAFMRSSAPSVTDCCGSHLGDVYVVSLDGQGPRQIGAGVGDWGGLTWSPDGTRVAAYPLASDKILLLALDPSLPPVEIPAPGNVGAVSWQARR